MTQLYDIAIIGGGFSGLMVAANAVRQSSRPLRVAWLDQSNRFARGTAYATTEDYHLLNVPAGRMSGWENESDNFFKWLQSHHPHYDAHDFVPRKIYGDYLSAIATDLKQQATLDQFAIEATTAEQSAGGFRLTLGNGQIINTKNLVLALGNPPAKNFGWPDNERFVADFWRWRLAGNTVPKTLDGPLVVLGTGLTTADAVLSARADGFTGEIRLLSNHGWLPRRHGQPPAPPAPTWPHILKDGASTKYYWHQFLQHYRVAESAWCLVDTLRQETPALWQALPEQEKARFARHLMGLWNIHRHRLPLVTAQKLEDDPNLKTVAGRIVSVDADGTLTIQRRGHEAPEQWRAGMLLNCTGPSFRTVIKDSPLLRNLASQNLVQPGPLGWGIATPTAPGIFTLGTLLTGENFESVAVPELRAQAQTVAALIL